MKHLLLCTCVLLTLPVSGQPHHAYDSLLHVLESQFDKLSKEEKEETLREMKTEYALMDSAQSMYYVDRSIALAEKIDFLPLQITAMNRKAYLFPVIDSREAVYNEMLALSEQSEYLKGKADALNGLGYVMARRFDNEKAVPLLKESISLNLQLGYDLDASNTYVLLGTIYSFQGDYATVNEYILKALEIDERLGDKEKILHSYINLGAVQHRIKGFERALEYYLKARKMAEEMNNKSAMLRIFNNMAGLYQDQNKLDEAMKLHKQSLALGKELNSQSNIAFSLHYLAECHFELNELDSALILAEESLQIFRKLKSIGSEMYPTVLIGKVYAEKERPKEAKKYLNRAKNKSLEFGFKDKLKTSTEYLARVEAALGNYKAAYENHILHKQMADSLLNESNLQEITKFQSEYAFKKEKDSIQYANTQEKLILDQKLQRERIGNYIALIGSGVLLLIVFILYRYYRSKQKANKLLQAKNEEIEHQRSELASLDKAKSRFFANISHELRTPLTLISGPLENLSHRRQYDDNIVHMALRNTKKLKELVNDILELSKLETSKPEVQKVSVNIKNLVNHIFSSYESLAGELGTKYILELSDTLPEWLLLDDARLEKIINNLLFNAIKYTEAEGVITMKVADQEGKLVISVSDTGQGIAEKDLPRIFDRYFQSKQPDAPIQGGTGIGLALARELARLMEGDLTVQSKLGLGSTFRVELPLSLAEVPVEIQSQDTLVAQPSEDFDIYNQPIAPSSSGEKTHKVLVAEDNHDMQAYIKQILGENYDVRLAINGQKALSELEKQDFDLVVTDAMMPGMDGFTLIERMKGEDRYRNIPVVMLTALSLEENKLKALSIGVDDYLTKPFSPPELLARVKNLITRYSVRMATMKEVNIDDTSSQDPNIDRRQNLIYKSDLDWLKEVEAVVLKEMANNDYQITDLADHFHLSKRQFQRKLKLISGMTYTEYHHEISLQKAREFLENGTYGNVTGVGYAVGMNNPSRFSEIYYKRFGKKPVDYFKERILD